MRVVCTIIATLWMAVAAVEQVADGGRADGVFSERCCPSLFQLERDPQEYHFRCEVATPIEGCDELDMSEHVPDTRINTEGGGTVDTDSYLLTDLKRDAFQPDIACAFYLPPVAGYCWQLYLVKNLAIDPIVTGDPCDCQCEDSVLFEQVDSQSRKVQRFCDFVPDGGAQREGWCDHVYGPDNVQGLQPYSADVSTGVWTTFRSDNINGVGQGAFVFAYAIPCAKKRSARKVPLTTAWPPNLKRTAYCHSVYSRCKNQACSIPCECYFDNEQRMSCILHTIFTDTTGRPARMNYRSPCEVFRRAARHALGNLKRFGRLIPTYSQLQNITTTTVQ